MLKLSQRYTVMCKFFLQNYSVPPVRKPVVWLVCVVTLIQKLVSPALALLSAAFIRVEKKFSEVVEGMQEGIDAYHIFGGCTIPFNYVFSCD